MESNNIFIIIGGVAIISFAMLWWAAKNAHKIDDDELNLAHKVKFEPRKMTDLSKDIPSVVEEEPVVVAPKKKYYRKNYNKKPIDNTKPTKRSKKSE